MSNDLAPLIARLEMRTNQYEKSLARAERKMNGASSHMDRRWKKTMGSMEKRAALAGKSFIKSLAVGTAVVGGFAAIGKAALGSASDMKINADVAGITAERYQELAYATDRYGITGEKLSDILKDVNDKTGDYLQNGAGPMAEWMDTIGSKMGLTANSFRNLSSEQVLGLYVKTMERAGASQKDMTFGLESLANDSVKLLPLLKNNGAELASLGKEARDAGLILSNEAAQGAFDANAELGRLGTTITTGITAAIVDMAPEIEDLTTDIIELVPVLIDWASKAIEGFTDLTAAINDFRALGLGGGSLSGMTDADINAQIKENASEASKLEEQVRRARSGPLGGAVGVASVPDGKAKGLRLANDLLRDEIARRENLNKKAAAQLAADLSRREAVGASSGGGSGDSGGIITGGDDKAAQKRLERELDAIRKLTRTELEQIEFLREARIKSINSSSLKALEKAELIGKVEAEAAKERLELEKELQEKTDDTAKKKAEAAEDVFRAQQDELGFVAEIAAATARMSGRALEAIQIEMDATRARYEAELDYINEVIAAKGLTPELAADKANAEAGIASVSADEDSLKKNTLSSIRNISDGDSTDLSAQLARLDEEQAEKLSRLEEFRSTDKELMRAYEEEKLQIEAEYSEKRRDMRLADINSQLYAASTLVGAIGKIGKEGSKAQKAAAKVQQGIALGRAAVNAAMAVSEAVASAPFPANIPAIAFATAMGGAQIAAIASQGFKDGVVDLNGPGTSRSDSIPARLSRGESVITAAGTRGNEGGLRGLNAGLSPEQAFGFKMPNLSAPNIGNLSSNSTSSYSFGGPSLTVQGNVDESVLPALQAQMAKNNRDFATNVNRVMDMRDKRTLSRTERNMRAR